MMDVARDYLSKTEELWVPITVTVEIPDPWDPGSILFGGRYVVLVLGSGSAMISPETQN